MLYVKVEEGYMKFILIILFCLFFNNEVLAETYYSEYSDFTEYGLEKIESSDVVHVETKRVYNKYFDIAEGGYYVLGENPSYYPYINVNIYKDTAFSDWSTVYPDDKYSRLIENRKICEDDDCLTYHWEFRYKDRLYYHYLEYQKKLGENSNLKGYIRSEDDYLEYYRYQVRDKLEIKDNIIITNIEDTFDQFITCSAPYEIEGTIDYTKNGVYQVRVITPFIEVPIQVRVLIVSNIESAYDYLLTNKDNDFKKIQSQLHSTLEQLKYLKEDYDIYLLEKETFLQELNNMKERYNICEENLFTLKQTSKVDKLTLETNLNENAIQLSLAQKQLSAKEKYIEQLNQKVIYFQMKLKNSELMIQKQEDSLKKLELCEKVNANLSAKVENEQEIHRQDGFYILFIGILLFSIVCAILKIKSMKKMN